MAWFKVDDRFWSHPKTGDLSDAATALWLRAGSWSAGHLTDGFIPAAKLRLFRGRQRSAAELVTAGLWSATEGGYLFHDWADYQPSKESVTAKREATKTRVDTWRNKRRNAVTETSQSEIVTPPPARPGPTRPDPSSKEEVEASLLTPGEDRKLKEHRLPEDWVPTAAHYELAKSQRVNILAQADAFRLHAETHDRRAARWNSAFTTWLKKSQPTAGPASYNPDAWMNA